MHSLAEAPSTAVATTSNSVCSSDTSSFRIFGLSSATTMRVFIRAQGTRKDLITKSLIACITDVTALWQGGRGRIAVKTYVVARTADLRPYVAADRPWFRGVANRPLPSSLYATEWLSDNSLGVL